METWTQWFKSCFHITITRVGPTAQPRVLMSHLLTVQQLLGVSINSEEVFIQVALCTRWIRNQYHVVISEHEPCKFECPATYVTRNLVNRWEGIWLAAILYALPSGNAEWTTTSVAELSFRDLSAMSSASRIFVDDPKKQFTTDLLRGKLRDDYSTSLRSSASCDRHFQYPTHVFPLRNIAVVWRTVPLLCLPFICRETSTKTHNTGRGGQVCFWVLFGDTLLLPLSSIVAVNPSRRRSSHQSKADE